MTRRYLPSSRALVQSMMSTMPFVKRPPRDPYRSTSATFAPVRAAAIAAAKPAGPPPTTTTSVVWKIGISRAGWRILPSFSTQLGPSVIVCSSGKMFLPNQTLSGSPQLPGGRALFVLTASSPSAAPPARAAPPRPSRFRNSRFVICISFSPISLGKISAIIQELTPLGNPKSLNVKM